MRADPGQDGQRQQQTRTFATTTKGLLALRDWLAGAGVTVVGMESTGAYCKAVYYLLEDTVACWLLNARHLRNVPGRKTDVADAAWTCQLVEHAPGPPQLRAARPIRELRNLTRYRKTVIEERTREASGWRSSSRTPASSCRAWPATSWGSPAGRCSPALVAGVRDPGVLAELAKGRPRAKVPLLQEALVGRFGPTMGCW